MVWLYFSTDFSFILFYSLSYLILCLALQMSAAILGSVCMRFFTIFGLVGCPLHDLDSILFSRIFGLILCLLEDLVWFSVFQIIWFGYLSSRIFGFVLCPQEYIVWLHVLKNICFGSLSTRMIGLVLCPMQYLGWFSILKNNWFGSLSYKILGRFSVLKNI